MKTELTSLLSLALLGSCGPKPSAETPAQAQPPAPDVTAPGAPDTSATSTWQELGFGAMGSKMTLLVRDNEAALAGPIATETFAEVDREASEWKASSPLSAVNAAAGKDFVAVPESLFALVVRAIELGQKTDGAFDVTWAALWGLWDFKAATPTPPADAEIDARKGLVDFRKVELDASRHALKLPREGMKIGLGGIGKGYALDLAKARLGARGVNDFLLSAGGQVYAAGKRDGRPWKVGIRDPRGGPEDHFALLEVSDASVSTSGDYERFFVHDGVRYHHILDPRTGRPSKGLRNVTVISSDATLADALSTAFMVLGHQRALELLPSFPGVEAVFVDESGEVHSSSGLQSRLVIRHPPAP